MTVFACKDAFVGLGLKQVNPSAALVTQDCSICTKPLAVHHNHSSPQFKLRGYHTAVRISSCGHMHGQECLNAWLDVGNSCPTCRRLLFELTGDPITQQDVNDLVKMLGPEYGEARVMVVVAGMMQKQEKQHASLRQLHEQEMAKQKRKDTGTQNELFLLSDDDFVDSDEEMDFDQEEVRDNEDSAK